MVYKSCFVYHKSASGKESCVALKKLECCKCKFYKTKEQAEDNKDSKEE